MISTDHADILSSSTPYQAAIPADFFPTSHIRPNKNFLKGYKPASFCAVMETAAGTISPHKNRLRYVDLLAYTQAIAETTAVWFDSQKLDGRTTAAARFFYVRTTPSRASSYGRALAGASSDAQVSYRACLSTRSTACPPHLTVDGRPPSSIGGRVMRQSTHAQTGLDVSKLIQDITRDAIKRAAVARTYADALDITGAALLAVAFLAKSGVQHG